MQAKQKRSSTTCFALKQVYLNATNNALTHFSVAIFKEFTTIQTGSKNTLNPVRQASKYLIGANSVYSVQVVHSMGGTKDKAAAAAAATANCNPPARIAVFFGWDRGSGTVLYGG